MFISNNFELTAEEIAQLYKYRWNMELFFKWIKQHLKVKSFWGTSLNALKIQGFPGSFEMRSKFVFTILRKPK
jgi:IS4 transposase